MYYAALPERIFARTSLLPDEEIVARVEAGDTALYEVLMRRYNQRLFRLARAILRDEHEAEDVVQHTYVQAYASLHQFAGRAKFSTWLAKIAVYEASSRLQKRKRMQEIPAIPDRETTGISAVKSSDPDPEEQALRHQTLSFLEKAIDALPDLYRSVFVLREIENMSTTETANCLDLTEEAVKVRLIRARQRLRKELYLRVGAVSSHAFQFMGVRCDRIVARVFDEFSRREPVPDSTAGKNQ